MILLPTGANIMFPNPKVVQIFFDTATFDKIERDVKVSLYNIQSGGLEPLLSLNVDSKVTMEGALSLIGGTMGLLTGFSILSGIEIIYFVIKFFLSLRKNICDLGQD